MKLNTVPSPALARLSRALPENCVERHSHEFGMSHGEPLTIAMDALYRYALAYPVSMGAKLADDYVLGRAWLESIRNLRKLLNGDGGAAWLHGRTTDSKSNGVLEELYWLAVDAAGYPRSEA